MLTAHITDNLGSTLGRVDGENKHLLAELIGNEIDQLLTTPGAWPEGRAVTIEVEVDRG